MAKAQLYIQFYNIKDSSNRAEYGPYVSIYGDGVIITGIHPGIEKGMPGVEENIAAYDEDRESYRVYPKSYPPFFYGYFEIITRTEAA